MFQNDISPLHLACHYDHPNVANLLLEKGASPHLASQNGHTPLHIAARKNQVIFTIYYMAVMNRFGDRLSQILFLFFFFGSSFTLQSVVDLILISIFIKFDYDSIKKLFVRFKQF